MAGVTYGNWTPNYRSRWAGDYRGREQLIPGGARLDPTAFATEGSVDAVVGVAGAAQGATSIPVAALSGPIPNGTVLRFSVDEYARLSAAAATGATTLTVEALVNALESGDTATYVGSGKRFVESGTLIGRTRAERDAGGGFGPWTTGDEEEYLLAFDVHDADTDPDCDLYRHGCLVKENLLPAQARVTAALARVRALYECQVGVE
jgi:hypothetical protein